MSGHISIAASKRCYNLYESYGEICVGCGCCSSNKRKRLEARLELHKRLLKHEQEFDGWAIDSDVRAIQERNVELNIEHEMKKIAQYEAELRGMEE